MSVQIDLTNEDYRIFERIAIALEKIAKALEKPIQVRSEY